VSTLKALACDFDGSLASDDASGPGTREAVAQARRAGVRIILVTGKTDHAQRGDFSQWVRGVFGDHDLARQLGKAEARWRRRELDDLRAAIDSVIVARYGDGARPGARQPHAAEAGP
jgi:hypothetical protein